MEQDLQIYENGQYKNIYPKTRYKRNGKNYVIENGQKVPLFLGLEDGNHTIVKKHKFVDGKKIEKPTYTMYVCIVEYKGEEVSFILYENDHEKYSSAGGVGDKVKISLKKETMVNPVNGQEQMIEKLYFDKVEE